MNFLTLLVFFVSSSVFASSHGEISPHSSPSVAASDRLAVVPSPVPSVPQSINADQAKQLDREFKKAQYTELKAVEHRQRLEYQELKVAQGAQRKLWNEKERTARHEFFKANTKGADRREYVKAFLERRKAYYSSLGDELKSRLKAHEQAIVELKTKQTQVAAQFDGYLKQGVRPPADLWPR